MHTWIKQVVAAPNAPCVHQAMPAYAVLTGSRTMHDQELPSGVQCTSVRLMLNLVEVLTVISDSEI